LVACFEATLASSHLFVLNLPSSLLLPLPPFQSLLSTLSADSTSPLPAYVQSLTEASQRTSQALGNDKSEQQEVQNWLNRIDKEGDAIAEDLKVSFTFTTKRCLLG